MHLGFFFHDCNPFYHTRFCGLLLIPIFSTMVKSMSLSWLHNHVVVFAWNDYIFLVISFTFCSSVVLFNTYIHRGCGICEKIMWRSCWSIYYRIQGQFLVYNFFFFPCGCIWYCVPTMFVANRAQGKVCCSFGNS